MTGYDFPLYGQLINHNMLANYRMIYIILRSALHWSQEIDHLFPGFSISNVARMVQCRWFTASESHQYHRFQLNIVPDVSSLDFPMGPPTFGSFTHHNICADKLVSCWTNRLDDLRGRTLPIWRRDARRDHFQKWHTGTLISFLGFLFSGFPHGPSGVWIIYLPSNLRESASQLMLDGWIRRCRHSCSAYIAKWSICAQMLNVNVQRSTPILSSVSRLRYLPSIKKSFRTTLWNGWFWAKYSVDAAISGARALPTGNVKQPESSRYPQTDMD